MSIPRDLKTASGLLYGGTISDWLIERVDFGYMAHPPARIVTEPGKSRLCSGVAKERQLDPRCWMDALLRILAAMDEAERTMVTS